MCSQPPTPPKPAPTKTTIPKKRDDDAFAHAQRRRNFNEHFSLLLLWFQVKHFPVASFKILEHRGVIDISFSFLFSLIHRVEVCGRHGRVCVCVSLDSIENHARWKKHFKTNFSLLCPCECFCCVFFVCFIFIVYWWTVKSQPEDANGNVLVCIFFSWLLLILAHLIFERCRW